MTRRPWSLARRLAGIHLLSILVFVLAISALSSWYVRDRIDVELDAMPHEELVELHVDFEDLAVDHMRLVEALREKSRERAPCTLAWRVWRPDGTVEAELDEHGLLERDRPSSAPGEIGVLREDAALRWKSETAPGGWTVGVVVDGAPRFELLHRYEVVASVVIVGGILSAFVMSTLFFRRVSNLMSEVARRARSVRATSEADLGIDLELQGAPIEIQEIANALREMLERVRSESRDARVFTAGLAHELRSPVQNLLGETEVALMQERDGAAYREVLRSNLEELRSLGDAIDNLVTICSAGDAHRSSARERFDLAAEAELRLRREKSFAERRGIELALVARGDALVRGDREALLRAVRNVTANAIQWTFPGTRVDVEIAGDGDRVVITVDDAGPGVPEEIKANIFEPFFRGPSARGMRIGYGLGLALARKAVDEQGGSIEVGRSPAGGARFRLVLPRLGPPPEPSAA